MQIVIINILFLFKISANAYIYIYIYIYTVSLKYKCNVLCERTDNKASGSREALAVILIKYNLKIIKTTVYTAILKIK